MLSLLLLLVLLLSITIDRSISCYTCNSHLIVKSSIFIIKKLIVLWSLISGHFNLTICRNKLLQLSNSLSFIFNQLFWFSLNTVISIEFFLQLNDCFVAFIQSTGQSNHNVSLFLKQGFVSVHLLFVFFDLFSLFFDVLQFTFVFLSD